MGQQLAEPVKRDGWILKNQAFVLGIWNFVFPSLLFLLVSPGDVFQPSLDGVGSGRAVTQRILWWTSAASPCSC